MNRLQSELHRLYLAQAPTGGRAMPPLIDPEGRVRALVIDVARPADWDVLSPLWRGVQLDLEWPAPAIAVSGTDGLQLWFSLAQPIGLTRATEALNLLRARYLADIAPARLRLWPVASPEPRHAPLVPAAQDATGHWSAFVAPDLAPVFADTPWLDIVPSTEGQADLLARLVNIPAPAFEAAQARLQPAAAPEAIAPADPGPTPSAQGLSPQQFLLRVMNDDRVALALRIEAAKALLPGADPTPPREPR